MLFVGSTKETVDETKTVTKNPDILVRTEGKRTQFWTNNARTRHGPHLITLEVHQHENLADLLHRYEVSREFGVLHHLAELVGLNGERTADARAGREAVVLEYGEESLVEWSNYFFHLRNPKGNGSTWADEGAGGGKCRGKPFVHQNCRCGPHFGCKPRDLSTDAILTF